MPVNNDELLKCSIYGGADVPISIEKIQQLLNDQNYIVDRPLALTLYLAWSLGKPVLLEGDAGVGKTEVAKALARALNTELIRLQCYEGIDASQALYEWNYARQIFTIRLSESQGSGIGVDSIYNEENLIKRPLLSALLSDGYTPPVLLIDEVDRADEEFEAFLLEILSDFQVTIPEIGTIKARKVPLVLLTSNRTRELNDALKRRCLYFWVDYPSREREYEIVTTKVGGLNRQLAREICTFMWVIRQNDLLKKPGIAETLDWAMALELLESGELTQQVIRETLPCIIKCQDDLERINTTEKLTEILQKVYDVLNGMVVDCSGML